MSRPLTNRPLSLGTWDARPIMYADWVRLAAKYPDQDFVWRQHELRARDNARTMAIEWVDIGGEG